MDVVCTLLENGTLPWNIIFIQQYGLLLKNPILNESIIKMINIESQCKASIRESIVLFTALLDCVTPFVK